MKFGGKPTLIWRGMLQRGILLLLVAGFIWQSGAAQSAAEKNTEARTSSTKLKSPVATKSSKPSAAVTTPATAAAKATTPHVEPTPAVTETPNTTVENTAASAAKDDKLPFKLNDRKETPVPPPSALGLVVRTIGALLLIVGMVFGAAWLLKRFDLMPFNTAKDEANGLKVVSTVRLGERRALSVVKFGEKTLLIGTSPEGLTLLSEQDEDIPVPAPQPGNARTVTDLLAHGTEQNFEREFARATTPNTIWSGRRN